MRARVRIEIDALVYAHMYVLCIHVCVHATVWAHTGPRDWKGFFFFVRANVSACECVSTCVCVRAYRVWLDDRIRPDVIVTDKCAQLIHIHPVTGDTNTSRNRDCTTVHTGTEHVNFIDV